MHGVCVGKFKWSLKDKATQHMNATVQCLRSVPELKTALRRWGFSCGSAQSIFRNISHLLKMCFDFIFFLCFRVLVALLYIK